MRVRELSRITGISPATISRMLKNPDSVKKSTKDKIYEALKIQGKEELLTRRIVERIVIILPELNNLFYSDLCNGIINTAQYHNIPCELYISYEDNKIEKKIFENLIDYKRTGVIWVPTHDTESIPTLEHCIILNIDREFNDDKIKLKVLCNNTKAAETATEILFQKGSKNLAMVTGDTHLTNANERADGFLNILKKYNIDDPNSHLYYGDFNNSHSSYTIMKELLSTKRYDGILAGNYVLAVGIIKAIQESNYKIPDDISIVTFNQIPSDDILQYPVTEVIFPSFEMGEEAVNILLQQTSYTTEIQTFTFKASFYVR